MAAVATIVQGTFPGWQNDPDDSGFEHDVRAVPNKASMLVSIAAVALSAALTFISILWQHTAAVAAATTAQAFGNSNIGSRVGVTAIALGWISFALLVVSLLTLNDVKRWISHINWGTGDDEGSDRGSD